MKLIFSLCLIIQFFFISSINAQIPSWKWVREFWSDVNSARFLAPSDSGSVYMAGTFYGTLYFDTQTLTATGTDCFLAKLDSSGSAIWARKWSSIGGIDDVYSITSDDSNNCYVTGEFYNTLLIDNYVLNGNLTSKYLLKFDRHGNLVYAYTIDGNFYTVDVKADHSGNIFLAGFFASDSVTFGAYTLQNSLTGKNDFAVIKLDLTGSVLWAEKVGGTNDDAATAMCLDPSGDIYVAGYFKSPVMTFGTNNLTSSGNAEMFLLKFDQSGNRIQSISSNNAIAFFGQIPVTTELVSDRDGNIIMAGFYDGSLNFGTTNLNTTGSPGGFIFKIRNNFSVEYAKVFGGSTSLNVSGATVDNEKNIYITGFYSNDPFVFASDTTVCAGMLDIYAAKLDSSANEIWSKKVGGSDMEMGCAIVLNTYNDVFVCGEYKSNSLAFDSHRLNLNVIGGPNSYLAKLGNITTGISELKKEALFVYPNPADNFIKVRFQGTSADLQIYSLEGRLLKNQQVKTNEKIDISEFNTGMYLINLFGNDVNATGKFIVD